MQREPVNQIRLAGAHRAVFADGSDVHVVRTAVAAQGSVGRRSQIVIRPLDKAPEVVGHLAGEEYTRAAKHEAVVALIDRYRLARFRIGCLVVPGRSDGSLRHHRHRHVVDPFLRDGDFANRVAGQLEVPAIGRQLGEADVTGNAFLPGLASVRRDGLRRMRRDEHRSERCDTYKHSYVSPCHHHHRGPRASLTEWNQISE